MYKAKVEFLWCKAKQEIPDEDVLEEWIKKGHVEKCEGSVPKVKEDIDLDFNNDGVVDEKDVSMAAKLMGKTRSKKKKSKKKK